MNNGLLSLLCAAVAVLYMRQPRAAGLQRYWDYAVVVALLFFGMTRAMLGLYDAGWL